MLNSQTENHSILHEHDISCPNSGSDRSYEPSVKGILETLGMAFLKNQPETHLNLSRRKLSANHFALLMNYLSFDTFFQSLDLSYCNLTKKQAQQLSRLMDHNNGIKKIELTGNMLISDSLKQALYMKLALNKNYSVKGKTVHYNLNIEGRLPINDSSIVRYKIMPIIKNSKQLALILPVNRFTREDLTAIFSAMIKADSLVSLKLTRMLPQEIYPDHFRITQLLSGLAKARSLRKITSLEFEHFSLQGIIATGAPKYTGLIDILTAAPKLQHCLLPNNQIKSKGGEALIRFLTNNNQIVTLTLKGNPLDDSVKTRIQKLLLRNMRYQEWLFVSACTVLTRTDLSLASTISIMQFMSDKVRNNGKHSHKKQGIVHCASLIRANYDRINNENAEGWRHTYQTDQNKEKNIFTKWSLEEKNTYPFLPRAKSGSLSLT